MNAVVGYLKQSDIFYQFTPTQLELVANLCHEASFNNGEIIFPAQSDSKELYVIAHGEVDILIHGEHADAKEAAIVHLRRGQSFGEVALVDEGRRSASARAAQDETRLLVLPRDQLIMLCETYPQLGYRLMHNLAADLAMKVRNADLRTRGGMPAQPLNGN